MSISNFLKKLESLVNQQDTPKVIALLKAEGKLPQDLDDALFEEQALAGEFRKARLNSPAVDDHSFDFETAA